jgi:DNA-binding MarR family transcriptional regulator
MIPIHEIPELDELRLKVAEIGAPFAPEQLYAFLSLIKTASIVSKALDEFFARHDLSLSRFSVLALLFFRYQSGLTSSDIAEKRSVSKATLTSVLELLEKDELIVRLVDPRDRRRQIIRLTTVGFDKLTRMLPEYQQFLHRVIGTLELDEVDRFLPVLKKFEAFGDS